jgi:ferredoxin
MRISVDADRCRGHAQCVLTAPDLFDLSDDDRAQAVTELVPASREQAAARASAACPEGAIARHQ